MINTENSFNACSDAQINYVMGFGLNQEDGILITPMALTHPIHPIRSRSGNKRQNLWVRW